MQLFILGRTPVEQHLFAQRIQTWLAPVVPSLPVFPAAPARLAATSAQESPAEPALAGIPLEAYVDDSHVASEQDPGAAYRQWRAWFQSAHVLITGADDPEMLFSLLGHDDRSALVILDEVSSRTGHLCEIAISAYLTWRQAAGRPIPVYRISEGEFETLTRQDEDLEMYDGPSQAFMELWAA